MCWHHALRLFVLVLDRSLRYVVWWFWCRGCLRKIYVIWQQTFFIWMMVSPASPCPTFLFPHARCLFYVLECTIIFCSAPSDTIAIPTYPSLSCLTTIFWFLFMIIANIISLLGNWGTLLVSPVFPSSCRA